MKDTYYTGKIVYLTVQFDRWLRSNNPNFRVPMANRLAVIVKVFDWKSKEGKILLEEREKTGKWQNIDPKDFKFVLRIYYPDLFHHSKKRLFMEEVSPLCYPGSNDHMFELVPDRMLKVFTTKAKEAFKIEKKVEKEIDVS